MKLWKEENQIRQARPASDVIAKILRPPVVETPLHSYFAQINCWDDFRPSRTYHCPTVMHKGRRRNESHFKLRLELD